MLSPTTFPPEQLTALRERSIAQFDLEELRLLVFDLDKNYDDLRGDTISGKTQALFEHLSKRSLPHDLIDQRKELRPHPEWHHILPTMLEAIFPYENIHTPTDHPCPRSGLTLLICLFVRQVVMVLDQLTRYEKMITTMAVQEKLDVALEKLGLIAKTVSQIIFFCKTANSVQGTTAQQLYSPIIPLYHHQPRSKSMAGSLCATSPFRRVTTHCQLTSFDCSVRLPVHGHSPWFTPVVRACHPTAGGRPEQHSTAGLSGIGGD